MSSEKTFALGQQVFFLEDNKVKSGEVESIQTIQNRTSNEEYIAEYGNGKNERAVKRPFGLAGVTYSLSFREFGQLQGRRFGASSLFESKQALLESL